MSYNETQPKGTLMKNKIKNVKTWTADHRFEIVTGMCLVPASVYAVVRYREHQKVNAYNAGVAEGVRRYVLKTLEEAVVDNNPA